MFTRVFNNDSSCHLIVGNQWPLSMTEAELTQIGFRYTEDQLDTLIMWYDRTVFPTKDGLKYPYSDEPFFHKNCLIEPVLGIIWESAPTTVPTGGYVLSKKAREIVKRREPLRLVIELMSRVNGSLPTKDLANIVSRIPFAQLPEILSCDDQYIRELAERKVRKRKFFASMR